MSQDILLKHRKVWREKAILRQIYTRWYIEISKWCNPVGHTLEIGGGGGNLKSFYPDLICSDYTFCPWLDLNLDAHRLPFLSGSLGNIVMLDVLHHLSEPLLFIKEAGRVLRTGGRLVMLEPCITPWSFLVYKYFHQEDVDFKYDVFGQQSWGGLEKQPFDGNMAIPSLIFVKNLDRFCAQFVEFTVLKIKFSDYLMYPLSGGFDHASVIPIWSVPFFTRLEKLVRFFGFILAYRLLVVLEKQQVQR